MVQKKANHSGSSIFLHNEETTLPSAATDSTPRYKKVQYYVHWLDAIARFCPITRHASLGLPSDPKPRTPFPFQEKKLHIFFEKWSEQTRRKEKKIPVHGLNTSSPKVEKIASCKPIHIPPLFIRRKRTNDGGGKQGRTKDREERGKKEKEGEREGEGS